jgi:DNA ligase 1
MRYADVVEVSRLVAATSKRTEKVALLADLLRRTQADEARPVVGMLIGEPWQGRIGVGWATLQGVASETAALPSLAVAEVDRTISDLADTTGSGSQRDREQQLRALMQQMTSDEQHHLTRLLTGQLLQGANSGVVSDAVAKAAGIPAVSLRRATMLLGDLGLAARRALAGESLDVALTPMTAVQPMLAATSATAAEAVAETGPASVEWKLDGIRVQAHKSGDQVRLFTRNLNDITASLPNVVTAVSALDVDNIVLDGESLWLGDDGRPHRFQDTISGLGGTDAFFFDVLHADGTSVIDEPLSTRKALLHRVVPQRFVLPSIETDDGDTADRFAAGAVEAGHEGVVVKALDSPYQAGRRGSAWRKVKPVHTLDLVVLAAEWGHGRRTGWLSNLHLGARAVDGSLVMVGKTFKGMTDELLRWQTETLQGLQIGTEGITVHVRPELVVEIALDGVQVSKRYPGGVALRFARVRRYRTDKQAADADTIEAVRGLL